MTQVPLYDQFSEDYDRFVDWEARLQFEMPFFRDLFVRQRVHRVLDVACGTGQHAIAFARQALQVTATDISQPMVERARANAQQAGVELDLHVLGFGEHAAGLHAAGVREPYDAVTCLGNSLPHVLTEDEMERALRDLAQVLRPGGVLVIQNRNMDRVLARRERFMPPQVHREGEREWLFMRFYDWLDDAHLRFSVVRLTREGEGEWAVQMDHTRLRAWREAELTAQLQNAGLERLAAYGSYRGEPFDPDDSGDLILVARRSSD